MENEAQAWTTAQTEVIGGNCSSNLLGLDRKDFTGYRCFINGPGKDQEYFSGLGW